MVSSISHLSCSKCEKTFSHEKAINLCQCGGPLLVRYDLEKAKQVFTKELLNQKSTHSWNMWRYKALLPVIKEDNIVSLGEGCTPLIKTDNLSRKLSIDLFIKDEGLNPTGTFKARGASAGVSKAKELGIRTIAMPTAGNAGGAWSAYGRKAGIELIVAMPEDATELAKKECFITGASTFLIKGLLSDAGNIIAKGTKKYNWFEVATLKEPYRIEGKKTMGFEIAEQFNWEMPDVIIYPTGGGVGIIGIWKAVKELEALGLLTGKRPRLVSVQAEGCRPIVDAFEQGKNHAEFYENAKTVIGGLRAPKVLGDALVLEAIRESGGTALAISDEEILLGMKELARTEGMFICPEGAAAITATYKLLDSGYIKPKETVCILNTGSGLKYAELVDLELPTLEKDGEINI